MSLIKVSSQPRLSMARLCVFLVGLLVLAAIVTWLAQNGRSAKPAPDTGAVITDASHIAVERPAGPAVNARANAAAASNATCREQQIDVTLAGKLQRNCVSGTSVVRNGSVRTYRVEPEDSAGRWLSVDTAGQLIVGAALGSGGTTEFKCTRETCAGITVGPFDHQGARLIVLHEAKLALLKPDAQPADEADDSRAAIVSGQVRTIPDDEQSATTCIGQALLVSVGEGTLHFCPDGGTGFDMDEDGGRIYRFSNGDGNSVAVALDSRGALRRVEYDNFACTSCSGVDLSPADADGQRNFVFRGTVLTEKNTGAATAILNGNVLLAPQ